MRQHGHSVKSSKESGVGESGVILATFLFENSPKYTLRKPGSNMRRKGSLLIQKRYQIWAYPFRIKVIRKAGSKSLIRNGIKYFCQMILKRIKIMILNRINLYLMILLQDQTESNIPTPGSKINLGYYRPNQEIHVDLKTGNILIQRDWNRNKSLTSSWKN